eukprot:COSAG02_NODE_3887_length_6085_cov_3.846809_1_plen_69_part_10
MQRSVDAVWHYTQWHTMDRATAVAALSSSSACCRVAAGMPSWVCALKERGYIQRLKGAEGYTKPAEEEA